MNLELAKSIRSKRHFEIKNGVFGFNDLGKMKGSFIQYFDMLVEKRSDSPGNYSSWRGTLKYLKKYSRRDVTFDEINKKWLEGFKDFLKEAVKSPVDGIKLSQNTQHSYFNKVRAALREAYKDGILARNPVGEVDGVKAGEPEREFLTYDELKAMSKASVI